ncbi:two-component response regulator-like APRR3 [Triticum urartu]|uniref:Two-component response regulator-like PRR95 n=2 Tax=Triticum urartu TaxID=4572 RepID=A0A8R7Q480_TRIUA|nr:two-component response regulator-like APRR3 [Triticum urartu]
MSPDADAGEPAAAAAGPGGGAARGVIRWDEILPRRSLRVLLVEHDDSTRQVVTALLRKCGYRVAAVADGMKAWEVMRGRAYAFDLVLTEVNMPTLSGIDLLSRIVAADECKNIPVIMMSSQDSIGTVLKCMQNGAVDFLVKPVRKNELRNLWQHVWRRHSMNSQLNASENNAASNHISVNSGTGSKTGENSDEESDAQSSGSKRETDIQSVEKLPEIVAHNGASSCRELKIQNGPFDRMNTKALALKGTDDAPSGNACGTSKQQVFSAEKNVCSKYLHGITSAKVAGQIMDNAMRIADASSCRPSDPGKDLMATGQPTTSKKCKSPVTKNNAVKPVMENTLHENSKGAAIGHPQPCPSHLLDVNLGKQQRSDGHVNQELRDKDNFNHSNSSAFSRYGNKRIEPSAKQLSLPSVHLTYQESVYDKNVQSSGALPSHEHHTCKITMQPQAPLDSCTVGPAIPSSSSAREDAGTSSSSPRKDNFGHPPYGFIPVPISVAAAIPYQYSAIMPPIYYTQPPFMQCDPSGINQMGIQHAYHSSYHQNLGKPSEIDEHRQLEENQRLHHSRQILQESGEPIDLLRAHAERNNQSASCSQDIRGWTVSGETDTNTNAIIAPESGNESGIQNFGYNGLDSDRSRREAALMKFRMKRKDRCFEKKVRYHSRKKLAEQRPRIKGQFVSQKLKSATTTEDAETD